MTKNKLASTALRAPHKPRIGFPSAPKLVFLATLSLYVASAPVAANPAVSLPVVGGLDVDFRCEGGEGGACPLMEDGTMDFGDDGKYLSFEAIEETGCSYTPTLTNNTGGIGSLRDGECSFTPDPRIGTDEVLHVEILDEVHGLTTQEMLGVYLNDVQSFSGAEGCIPTTGTVSLELKNGTTEVFPWSSDATEAEGGEGGEGGASCAEDASHAIYVDFGGSQEVMFMDIDVESPENFPFFGAEGRAYAAGLEVPRVIELVADPLTGGDLRALIADDLPGDVIVDGGFPVRVRDPRAACQWDAGPGGAAPGPLVFDDSNEYDYYSGTTFNEDEELPLLVSDVGGTKHWFTVSGKGCGVPRMTFDGVPVPRGTAGSIPWIDIIAIGSDIEPTANTLEFKSNGLDDTLYACQPELVTGMATLDQPFLEINARADEIKYLSGVPGMIDPTGRDIMSGCGSKRGVVKGFSFVAWNLVHAPQTDMRAELDAEIQVLSDTVGRLATCVDPSYFYGQLVGWPYYINLYYDYSQSRALIGDEAGAKYYFGLTAVLVDWFKQRLEAPGVRDGMDMCYASGPNLDTIISTATPGPGDQPLNAYGDIISQLTHLSYAIKSFKDELSEPPVLLP